MTNGSNSSNNPGKGRKFCLNPECKKICNAPSKKCFACGYIFAKLSKASNSTANVDGGKEKEKKVETRKIQVVPPGYENYRILSTIYVPAGQCPIKLKNLPTKSDLVAWAHAVRIHFLKLNGMWILNHALNYYLRYDYSYNMPERTYEKLCAVVNEIPDLSIKEIPV